MKDIIVLQEKANLLEQEVKTLTEKITKLESGLKAVEDVRLEIKGLKVFLGRMYPLFKSQLPEILKKLTD
jgi:uncharacterized protein YlxW (UPF0749 family)